MQMRPCRRVEVTRELSSYRVGDGKHIAPRFARSSFPGACGWRLFAILAFRLLGQRRLLADHLFKEARYRWDQPLADRLRKIKAFGVWLIHGAVRPHGAGSEDEATIASNVYPGRQGASAIP